MLLECVGGPDVSAFAEGARAGATAGPAATREMTDEETAQIFAQGLEQERDADEAAFGFAVAAETDEAEAAAREVEA